MKLKDNWLLKSLLNPRPFTDKQREVCRELPYGRFDVRKWIEASYEADPPKDEG